MNLELQEINELGLQDSTLILFRKKQIENSGVWGSDFLSLNFDYNTMSKFLKP